jgi:hypothetical protein
MEARKHIKKVSWIRRRAGCESMVDSDDCAGIRVSLCERDFPLGGIRGPCKDVLVFFL